MKCNDAVAVPGAVFWRADLSGPLVPPGEYEVRLSYEGTVLVRHFRILKDPKVQATQEEFAEQFHFLMELSDRLSEVHKSVNATRTIRQQAEALRDRLVPLDEYSGTISRLERLLEQLSALERRLIQVDAKTPQDLFNFPPMLNNQLAYLARMVGNADSPPTAQAREVLKVLSAESDRVLNDLRRLLDSSVREFEEHVRSVRVPVIVPARNE
jgi:hypothetical protein